MGMYDDVLSHGDALRCAHGHVLAELQTKSMGCELDTYHLYMGNLFIQQCYMSAKYKKGVEDGVMVKVYPHCQTRDDVRRELEKSADGPLPDDDQIVARHLELLARRKR
jgi:hypothetical protein